MQGRDCLLQRFCTATPVSRPQGHNLVSCVSCVAPCRDEIASCSESAYSSLRLADAQKLMMFKSPKEAEAYAKQVGGEYVGPARGESGGKGCRWAMGVGIAQDVDTRS